MTPVRRSLFSIAALVSALALLAFPLRTWAQGVALVIDRIGQVSLAAPSAAQPVATLATLPVGSTLQLERASSLTLLFLVSGDEYTVTGPGAAQVDAGGVSAADGALVQRRAPSAAKPLHLRSESLAMGGVVMRSSGLHARAPAGLLTMPPSRLVWDSLATRANYRVELRDAAGTLLFEQRVNGLTQAFPPDVTLKPDEHYTWTVTREADGGVAPSASASFSFAGEDVRDQAQRQAPRADATFADRVVYALWLEQIGALGEAREMWLTLSDQRPDDDALFARAHR